MTKIWEVLMVKIKDFIGPQSLGGELSPMRQPPKNFIEIKSNSNYMYSRT